MRSLSMIVIAAAVTAAAPATAAPAAGQPAPAFAAKDAEGKTHSLSDYRGKTVILEWTNEGCPYVRKHYDAGAMQKLQRDAAAQGHVWLTVATSAPGQQGHLDAAGARRWQAKEKAAPAAVLLDGAGVVGRAYEAKTTPHMFVIDPEGKVAYMGAIDDRPSSDPASLKGAKNYVAAALSEMKAGRKPAPAATRPYGCSVKYGG